MNIVLWILQTLLAIHTAIGAVWKFSNSEQAVPSIKAISHAGWMTLSGVELLCVAGLLLPAVGKSFGLTAPIAAAIIAGEMLLFCALHLRSGDANSGPMIYWLVVAALCAIIAVGRFALRPH